MTEWPSGSTHGFFSRRGFSVGVVFQSDRKRDENCQLNARSAGFTSDSLVKGRAACVGTACRSPAIPVKR